MANKPYVIVVGTDYSENAERALRSAYEQACAHAPAELHVVHASIASGADAVWPTPGPGGLAASPILSMEEQKDQLVKYLDGLIAKLPGYVGANVRVVAHLMLDAPMFGVTRLAAQLEADLIVVGSHGRHGLARWLLGSVAEGVVRQATTPVLVVPPSNDAFKVPSIEPACPKCVAERQATAGRELWCEQHREHHGRRHTYHQGDRGAAETNFPLVTR